MYQVGDIIWWVTFGGTIASGMIFAIQRLVVWVRDDEGAPIDIAKSKIIKRKRMGE